MKRLPILIILLLASAANVFPQSAHNPQNPLQARFDSLWSVSRSYLVAGKVDKLPPLNARMLQIAEKLRVDSTFTWVYNSIANYFSAKADYSMALEYNFKAIEIADRGFKRNSTVLYGNVASIYNKLGNYEAALQYMRNGEKYMMYGTLLARTYVPEMLAITYVNLKKPDSALKYVQLAFQVNMDQAHRNTKDPREKLSANQIQASIYRIFGQVYEMLREPELVNYYYRKSIRFSDSLNFQGVSTISAIDYGTYLLRQRKYNEAKNYGIKSFNIACNDHFKNDVVEASGLLYDVYAGRNNKDSAFYYVTINHLYRDSIAAEQKTNQLQGLIINQQLKEAEQQAKAEQDAEQRHRNIEYAIIALGLVVLVMLFLLLSRSIIVNTRVIEVVGVIGLLILFEFINLIIHPYLVQLTNDSPLFMLLILVAIAAIIVPLHHRLEHWVKHKLVEKNKTIRLEAAKRTIEQLGSRKPEV